MSRECLVVWIALGCAACAAVAQENRDVLGRQFSSPVAALKLNLESTYDWNIPADLTYSKVTRIGRQMLSFAGCVRYYLTPGEGPDWRLRFVVTLLYPAHST